jgi:hypothetical protein
MKIFCAIFVCFSAVCSILSCSVSATVVWDDIFYSTGPYKGSEKIEWNKMTEEQRAFDLERYRNDINYCLENIGKTAKDLDHEKDCCAGNISQAPVSYYLVALKYMRYGDSVKEAEYYYKDWLDSKSNPRWLPFNAEEAPLSAVIFGYEKAGMHKEALPLYGKAHKEMLDGLKAVTDIKLIKNDFKKYKKNWPDLAKQYQEFMHNWEKAKKLAKTTKPKPLEPAVQHHEWFYSEKREEVLKALGYYHQNKVQFMLEKALKHKDPIVAAKAREYLEDLKKDEKNESENKKP